MSYNVSRRKDITMINQYYGIPKDAKYGEEFMSRFPILFQQRGLSMQETCMCWGIECPIGWYHILEQLCTILEFHNQEFKKNYGVAIVADQVKEKFGTLRFYFTVRHVNCSGIADDQYDECTADVESRRRVAMDYLEMLADQYINEAECMTEKTCADCGTPLDKDNKVTTDGWITFICKDCDKKRVERAAAAEEEEDDDEPDPIKPAEEQKA